VLPLEIVLIEVMQAALELFGQAFGLGEESGAQHRAPNAPGTIPESCGPPLSLQLL
jgi:hypothetical protein